MPDHGRHNDAPCRVLGTGENDPRAGEKEKEGQLSDKRLTATERKWFWQICALIKLDLRTARVAAGEWIRASKQRRRARRAAIQTQAELAEGNHERPGPHAAVDRGK